MNGFIKLHRKLLENPLWTCAPPACFRVALVLLLGANWKSRKWFDGRTEVVIPRGSVVTSRPTMCKLARVTPQQYRSALAYLQLTQFSTSKTTNRYTVVTITNYERYQGEADREEPTEEHSNNQQITTPKEGKKGRTGLHQDLDLDRDCPNSRKNGGSSDGSSIKPFKKPVIQQYPDLAKIMYQMRDWGPNEKKAYPSDRKVAEVMDAARGCTETQVVNFFAAKYHRHGIQPGTPSAPTSWKWFATVIRRHLQQQEQQQADDEAASDPEELWDKGTGQHV